MLPAGGAEARPGSRLGAADCAMNSIHNPKRKTGLKRKDQISTRNAFHRCLVATFPSQNQRSDRPVATGTDSQPLPITRYIQEPVSAVYTQTLMSELVI